MAGIETVKRDGVNHYLLPAHRNSRRHDIYGDRRQFVLESTSLVHWSLAGYIPYADDDPVFLHEGKIAQTDDPNVLKMVMRTATMDLEQPLDPPLAYSSISRDGGTTWSISQVEPDLPNHRSKAFFGKDANGNHIYVYSNRADRRGLYYKSRKPGGDWSKEKTFYFNNDRNSYPTLLEDSPGEWLAVWDSSNTPDRRRTVIRFGRLINR